MELSSGILFVYCTFSTRAEAERVSALLVKENLAACANVMAECTSFFNWKGNFQTGRETPAVLKTTAKRYPALEKRIRQLHSYENPAIVALPVTKGSKPYLKWVGDCCKPAGASKH
jgi:periplasmic divalent cation tolerance protein